jgi:phytoene synthase
VQVHQWLVPADELRALRQVPWKAGLEGVDRQVAVRGLFVGVIGLVDSQAQAGHIRRFAWPEQSTLSQVHPERRYGDDPRPVPNISGARDRPVRLLHSSMDADQRARGRDIHRRTGRTFYYATRLLPRRVREPTYALYGFFRVADEVVDGADGPETPAGQRQELERLRRAALGDAPAENPVVAGFASVREDHEIPATEVEAFVDAMQTDVDRDSYERYADLEGYMRGSAAAVGHMMTAVMDPADPEAARPHAAALGEAFQLTNFCRDVREDVEDLGRVYLPQRTLDRFGVTEADLRSETASDGLRRAVRAEVLRAEERYRTGVEGLAHLPRDCQFPVLAAAVLYAEHHRLIRRQDFDVLATRPSLSRSRKLWRLARTYVTWRRLGDPVAVFDRVSAVPGRSESRSSAGGLARPTGD